MDDGDDVERAPGARSLLLEPGLLGCGFSQQAQGRAEILDTFMVQPSLWDALGDSRAAVRLGRTTRLHSVPTDPGTALGVNMPAARWWENSGETPSSLVVVHGLRVIHTALQASSVAPLLGSHSPEATPQARRPGPRSGSPSIDQLLPLHLIAMAQRQIQRSYEPGETSHPPCGLTKGRLQRPSLGTQQSNPGGGHSRVQSLVAMW